MRYTVRAAARATGVTEGRLRTWERRYGIPKPGRSDTGRRLYDDDDLAMIRRMVALTDAGLAAAEAAEAVLAEAATGVVTASEPAPEVDVEPDPAVAAMVAAARTFDEPALHAALEGAVEAHGWPAVLDAVILPALRLAGEAWERGDATLSHEHFLSEILRARLGAQFASTVVAPGAPLAVLACPPTERHDLGLLALGVSLRLEGVRVLYLGADVPREALLSAVEESGAAAVCLSAVATSARPDLVIVARAVATARQGPRLFVGGAAVHARDGGAELMGVRLPRSVVEAAALVAAELGVS